MHSSDLPYGTKQREGHFVTSGYIVTLHRPGQLDMRGTGNPEPARHVPIPYALCSIEAMRIAEDVLNGDMHESYADFPSDWVATRACPRLGYDSQLWQTVE